MAAAATEDAKEKELLSSVVGDIRSYSGSDPLRPWLRYGTRTHRFCFLLPVLCCLHASLPSPHRPADPPACPLSARGLRKMERALLPATLREKLPRFMQKCAQQFQADARYRDDPRYLRVWIQLVSHP